MFGQFAVFSRRARLTLGTLLLAFPLLASPAAGALTGDDLLLIVNKTVPAGRELAEFYATARKVPAGRIVEIEVADLDELSAADYELQVAGPVRRFLKGNQLGGKVKCLVTFYGVPLRIAPRKGAPNDQAEARELQKQLAEVEQKVVPLVAEFEKLGRDIDPTLPTAAGKGLAFYGQRIEQVVRTVQPTLLAMTDATRRQGFVERFNTLNTKLREPIVAAGPPGEAGERLTQPQVDDLVARREDAGARAKLRLFARQQAGLFGFASVLGDQLNTLSSTETDAALDSELSLVNWPNYPRTKWLANPLNIRLKSQNPPPTLMVARLDAPTPALVKKMIETSLVVEKEGLKGRVIIDGRGIAEHKPDGSIDGFGQFDQYLRNTVATLKRYPGVEVLADDRPPLFAPHSVKGVAVYCGWYSVGQYVPSFNFVDGAVGYHVASYELLSMHRQGEKGWVPNLIKDGVVGTLGAVAEPYLHAFPRPDDFIPLLLTGKLTMAEVYWKTCPLVSWKMSFVGDPLYMPFASNPAVQAETLPEPLKSAVR